MCGCFKMTQCVQKSSQKVLKGLKGSSRVLKGPMGPKESQEVLKSLKRL